MDIRPMTQEEHKYTFAQSQQLRAQCGSIGKLRGDFGSSGQAFYTTWEDDSTKLKTQEFRDELDTVVNGLRSGEHGLLTSRKDMYAFVSREPSCQIHESWNTQYGFRVDTDKHAFLFRCNPVKGDYNFYCYCYVKQWLDGHIQTARQGIRFITPDYKEKFRIPDGGQIIVSAENGRRWQESCRYIDETHAEIGDRLYHICEYAEKLEHIGAVCEPKSIEKAAKGKAIER